MGLITNILFPVDFSPSSIAMGPYVKRAAALLGARVSLIHVFQPFSNNGLEQYVRAPGEIAEEHEEIGRNKLHAFLAKEFPVAQHPRILVAGDPAREIVKAAHRGFDLIMMPTHAGVFRRMLLGSTTAKVLDAADCPVATSLHAIKVAPRPMEHREWLCAIALSKDSERVLRYAHHASQEASANLRIIHAIQGSDPRLPVRLDLEEQIQTAEKQEACERIDALQRKVGCQAKVRITAGPPRAALVAAIQQSDADALIIGRSPRPGSQGRLRDLTYAMVRDSPVPVISV
ncbi:MAG: universal stress protein [Terracidiphilus sp.]|nr:universal stress protein [Terracidiphilus sp.]MDR3798042.1 universal stress protein [Terracidiphilus sp.]